MRTTLTLDDDVAASLERLRKTRHEKMKEIINSALREGLKQMTAPPARRLRFRTESADLGRCFTDNIDNIADILAVAEDESFR